MSDVTGKELQADVSRWMEWIREMMASDPSVHRHGDSDVRG